MEYVGNFQTAREYHDNAIYLEYPAVVSIRDYYGDEKVVKLPKSFIEAMQDLVGFAVETTEEDLYICLGMWVIYNNSTKGDGTMKTNICASIPEYVERMYVDGLPVDLDQFVYSNKPISGNSGAWIGNTGFVYKVHDIGRHTVFFELKQPSVIGDDLYFNDEDQDTMINNTTWFHEGHLTNIGLIYKPGSTGLMVSYADVYIPTRVRTIGFCAFADTYINYLNFWKREKDDTLSISMGAFDNAFISQYIEFPAQTSQLHKGALYNLTANDVSFGAPSQLTTIPSRCCRNALIRSLTIPEGVETIKEYSLALCINTYSSTVSVSLPSTVKSIGQLIFGNADTLGVTKLIYNGTEEQWNKIDFEEDWEYAELTPEFTN